jgi:hypothetical protein
LTFIERMYGIKFQSETIINYEDLNKFESGLVTLFNTQTIEQVRIFLLLPLINIIKLIYF